MITPNIHVEGRTEGAARGNLSRKQMLALLAMAREAFAMEFPPSGESFDAWRCRQAMQVVEKAGFRLCRNEDFLPLKTHFLRLQGRDMEADAALEKSESESRTWALHGLEKACSEVADVLPHARNYALGMLRKKGMDLENADARSLYRALYTVKRRAQQLRKKG